MNYAVIGFGNRGNVYTTHFLKDERVKLVAVCDKKQIRLDIAQKKFAVPSKDCYLSDVEFFSKGKLADLLVVSTQDADHYGHAISGLKAGYDLLLEKPIADSLERCEEIYRLALALKRRVFVCHVLRYAPFYNIIKDVIDSGEIGEIVTVNMTENVAYWHQAHSYVRGNWGITEKSTPMILAKCCHDLDILSWYFGDRRCNSVSSFGSLDYFVRANAPENSADYCYKCPHQSECAYDCVKFYQGSPYWLAGNNWYDGDYKDKAGIAKALENEACPYARCVFKCDNTAVDHQVVNMQFDGGATAHLTMTAFTAQSYREIHVHGTKGDISGDNLSDIIKVAVYGKEPRSIDAGKLTDGAYGHGGGDERLARDIIAVYEGEQAKGLTSIQNSFVSHSIGYAAEESRKSGGNLVHVRALK